MIDHVMSLHGQRRVGLLRTPTALIETGRDICFGQADMAKHSAVGPNCQARIDASLAEMITQKETA